MPTASSQNSLVIFGGFLSRPGDYTRMRCYLEQVSGQAVWVVGTHMRDWLRATVEEGWARLLDRLADTVRDAAAHSPTGKVTLIGHSAGGVMSRLFLSPNPFRGRIYRGTDNVTRLVTLGSPHYNVRGTRMRQWVQARYPDAFFAPQVQYIAVAGAAVRGDPTGSLRERFAYAAYRQLGGIGAEWGDGLVPVSSALLVGAQHLVLEGVRHYSSYGGPWYCEPGILARYWQACLATDREV